ncbi:MAG: hypothetical protein ACLQDQ_19220 [Myxococcaceae bacterium]
MRTYERAKFQDVESVAVARMALGRALGGLNRYQQAEQQLLDSEQLLAKAKGLPREDASRSWLLCMTAGRRPNWGQATRPLP